MGLEAGREEEEEKKFYPEEERKKDGNVAQSKSIKKEKRL
jgi:hypothetical protein